VKKRYVSPRLIKYSPDEVPPHLRSAFQELLLKSLAIGDSKQARSSVSHSSNQPKSGSYTEEATVGGPNPENRRSQRVLLQLAVLIRARGPKGERFESQAFTLVVNAYGGLLESSILLVAHQKIRLANPQTNREAFCTVVRVEGPIQQTYKIAFEFDERSPQFWPITFPPEDWKMAKEVRNDTR
jgi:hypothetical protein